MREFRYIEGVATLRLDREACVGCELCLQVCPHDVFEKKDGRCALRDRDGCMECGACARNCPTGALAVTPGVGCAAYIIATWLHTKPKDCR